MRHMTVQKQHSLGALPMLDDSTVVRRQNYGADLACMSCPNLRRALDRLRDWRPPPPSSVFFWPTMAMPNHYLWRLLSFSQELILVLDYPRTKQIEDENMYLNKILICG